MVITGHAATFEEGIRGFKENLHVIAKLLGDKAEYNETAVITLLLQKVFEERKHFQNGKEPRSCEMVIKPNVVEYHAGGISFGWSIMADGHYEFYLMRLHGARAS